MLISHLKEIERLRQAEVRNRRSTKAEAFVCDGSLIVIKLPGGRWWSNWRDFNKFARLPGMWPRQKGLLHALVILGLISEDVTREHIAHCEKLDRRNERKYHTEELERIGKKWNVKMPTLPPVE